MSKPLSKHRFNWKGWGDPYYTKGMKRGTIEPSFGEGGMCHITEKEKNKSFCLLLKGGGEKRISLLRLRKKEGLETTPATGGGERGGEKIGFLCFNG